ncbi:MAG: ABC transporter ATP-binding protein [Oscillospiraceae bacterium]|nr:ABC transporter ATP-binding protein [Oscillospiraceae bacterium]
MSEDILKLNHLTKQFGRRKAVDDLTLSVRSGEIFGFLGPNGAGKTTTIKMVMGFLFEDTGHIEIGGYDLRHQYGKAMAQVGGIVENPEMYGQFSGRQNLEMYARLHGLKDRRRIDEVVRLVGMDKRINEKVKRYSLGMKQRVGLAQALVHRPRLLILDEPTNGLDPDGIHQLRDLLKNLAHQEGVAVMVSSHQLAEMQMMCDRVGIINQGRLLDVRLVGQAAAGEAGGAAGIRPYRIELLPPEAARGQAVPTAQEALAALPEGWRNLVHIAKGQALEAELDPQQLQELLGMLLAAGIPLSQVLYSSRSLEDLYFSVTGGGQALA